MTPLAIETLLNVYCSPNAKLLQMGIQQCGDLIEPDMISHPHGYILTERGKAMVSALTGLPSPTKVVSWYVSNTRG